MDLLNESGLTPGWLVAHVPPHKLAASFLLKGTFKLKSQAPAELAETQDDLEGDVPETDGGLALRYTRDLTPVKLHIDLLFSATAYAPAGKPVDMFSVTCRVGAWSKSLAVIGERVLTRGLLASATTPPAPFTSMPMTWSRAVGGKAFPANPGGRGLDEERDGAGSKFARMPNVVRMDEGAARPQDLREPAGFGPLSPDWPQRMQLVKNATYNARWVKETWPAPPRDFDWSYFNAAPVDQRLPAGTLRGDEPVEFVNLHPAHPRFAGRLPGIRPRLFLLAAPAAPQTDREEFREVPLQIDTLWCDPSAEKLVLLWRGVSPIRTKGMKEVDAVVIVREPLSQNPHPATYYLDLLKRRRRERTERENAPAPAPPVFEPLAVEKPSFDWAAWEKSFDKAEQDIKGEADEASREVAQKTRAAAEKELKAQGIPTRLLDIRHPQDPASILAQSAKDRAAAAAINPAAAKQVPPIDASKLGVDAQVAAAFAAFDKAWAAPVVPESGPDAPPEPRAPEADGAWTRERVVAHHASGKPFVRLDLRALDLSGLDLSGARFEGCVLAATRFEATNLARSKLSGCSMPGALLQSADLTDAALLSCDLAGANFTSTVFTKTTLDGSDCSDGCFEKARLEDVSAVRTGFSKATFRDASINRCSFAEADLLAASLAGLTIVQTSLRAANAYGLKAAGATFDRCDLTNVRAGDGADFTGARFPGLVAPGSVWEGAVLDRANLAGADLRQASFASASLKETLLGRANLSKARLPEANLTKAQLQRANLFRGSLEGARLDGADLSGANLYEVEFLDSVRDLARFDQANVKGTKLA